MTIRKLINSCFVATAFATILATSSPLVAQTFLDWQFDDENGTPLNQVLNTGTIDTAFNFGGPRTQNGVLNIGATPFFVFPTNGFLTGSVFRTVEFEAISTGSVIFEFVVADWDLGGLDDTGITNNGIRFIIGDVDNGSLALEFEVSQDPSDIRVRSQRSTDGTLNGTDAQFQLGSNDVNTSNGAVVVQLIADLDTGVWSTRTAGANGVFADLVTDGTGLNSINRIQLVMDAVNGDWAEEEFVTLDSITLSANTGSDLLGDFDMDGDVDLDDLDQYIGNIGEAADGALAALDFDGDGTVGANDFEQHYTTLVETSNGATGTFAGDANLDGMVNVLGDAFVLVGNLGNVATSWGQGDFNGDGTVNVLGDAFVLVGNLGASNAQ